MMAQTLLTPTIITRKALASLYNNMVMPQLVHRKFEANFAGKIGTQLTVRKPNKFVVRDGPVASIQDINEPSVIITVDKYKGVDFEFSDADMALTIEEFSARYIDPAMIPLANQVDYDLLTLANTFSNVVGTPGSTPSTFATSVQLTGQRLDENAAPQEGRNLVLNPAAAWAMAGAQSNAFVTRVSEKALINGYLNVIGNQSIFMDQNVQNTAASTYGGTPLTNAATPQTGASLITDGWTATTTVLTAGTVFTIDGVYAVNPVSFQSTGQLKNFVVTANTVTDGSGNSTIAIEPAIITSGPFQNVTNGAANNKAITVLTGATTTSHPNNFAFTKEAMGLVMVPLPKPQGMDMSATETYKGISMRFVRGFDIVNAQFISRLDILYGVAKYYDELGVRLIG
jgi:hypothetical protein